MAAAPDVVIGVVGKPLGLKGDVLVRPEPDIDYAPESGDAFQLDDGRTIVVAAVRQHSGRQVIRFEGVTSRDDAERLRGALLRVPRDRIALDDDAFWSDDLKGRDVVDDSGAVVGVVETTLDGAAHDYLVIARPDGGEVLVPAVAELVEVAADRIVVRAVPGLLDNGE